MYSLNIKPTDSYYADIQNTGQHYYAIQYRAFDNIHARCHKCFVSRIRMPIEA